MALTPAFSVSNNATNTNSFVVTDTSTGSDGTITTIQFQIYDDTNTPVLNSPISFPYVANSTYTIPGLTQDLAVNIVTNWLNVGGTVLYTANQIFVFTGFLEWFYYSLVQQIAAKATIANDTNFISNLSWLRTLIDSANQSISVGASIFNAANMLSLAQNLQTNQTLYF